MIRMIMLLIMQKNLHMTNLWDDESEEAYDYGYEEAYDYWMDERGDDGSD